MTNLAPFPNGWATDTPWGIPVPSDTYGVIHDTSTTHNGAYTFRVDPNSNLTLGAFDYYLIPVKPGDHVIIKCWVKTNGVSDNVFGARVDFDWYGAPQRGTGRIAGWDQVYASGDVNSYGFVNWGHDWTHIVADFTVPSTVTADGEYDYTSGDHVVPTFIILWNQVWSSNYPTDSYSCWFSDYEVYVNPEGPSGNILRVQGPKRGTGTSNSVSVTMDIAPTNGNVLVATIGSGSAENYRAVASISQVGVTWTKQKSSTFHWETYEDVEIWFGVVGEGASASITVNLIGTAEEGAIVDVCEYSGVAVSGFLDKTASNSGSAYQTDTGTTDVTSQANELLIGAICDWSTVNQNTPTNGFSLLDGATLPCVGLAYLEKIVSAVGAANSGTNQGAAGNGWVGCIATFFAVTPPSPTPAVTIITQQTLANTGILAGVGIQVAPTSIDWGVIVPGASKTVAVQVTNRSMVPQTLKMTVATWGLAQAQSLLTVTWNKENTVVPAGESITATLTLTASQSTLGDTKFSFSISITGVA